MVEFGTLADHLNELLQFVVQNKFQLIETSTESKVAKVAQEEPSLLLPKRIGCEEYSTQLTIRISHPRNERVRSAIEHWIS